jgi:ElaB/YqjD/DUF883 family membrane-anchored ribosome-binding protein
MNTRANDSSFGSADWLVNAVTKNPEGLLLLAAGFALLLRSGGSKSGQRYQDQWMQNTGDRRGRWQTPQGVSQMADEARDYASQVAQTVSEIGQKVGETADQYATAAGEYVSQARRTVMDQSGRLADQAQGTVERIVRDQPLAVAIAGLAAGAAVAAAFPVSRVEQEALGSAGQKLAEAASTAGEKLSDAASAASGRLKTAAEERGLSAGGLKEVARDVASTFQDSLTGNDKDKTREPSSNKQASAGEHPSESRGGQTVGAGQASSTPAGRSSTEKDRPGNR